MIAAIKGNMRQGMSITHTTLAMEGYIRRMRWGQFTRKLVVADTLLNEVRTTLKTITPLIKEQKYYLLLDEFPIFIDNRMWTGD